LAKINKDTRTAQQDDRLTQQIGDLRHDAGGRTISTGVEPVEWTINRDKNLPGSAQKKRGGK
jgi:hypothetical protein